MPSLSRASCADDKRHCDCLRAVSDSLSSAWCEQEEIRRERRIKLYRQQPRYCAAAANEYFKTGGQQHEKTYEQDIREILYGATLLGAGGGGSISQASACLTTSTHGREDRARPAGRGRDCDDEYACMVAGLGSPGPCSTQMPSSGLTPSTRSRPSRRLSRPRARTSSISTPAKWAASTPSCPCSLRFSPTRTPTSALVHRHGQQRPRSARAEHHPQRLLRSSAKPLGLGRLNGDEIGSTRDRPQRRADSAQHVHALQYAHRFATWGLTRLR